MALSSSPQPVSPARTRKLRAATAADPDTTDYQLSASVGVPEETSYKPGDTTQPQFSIRPPRLDAVTDELFHLIAADVEGR